MSVIKRTANMTVFYHIFDCGYELKISQYTENHTYEPQIDRVRNVSDTITRRMKIVEAVAFVTTVQYATSMISFHVILYSRLILSLVTK